MRLGVCGDGDLCCCFGGVSGTLGGAPGNYVAVGNCTCVPGKVVIVVSRASAMVILKSPRWES